VMVGWGCRKNSESLGKDVGVERVRVYSVNVLAPGCSDTGGFLVAFYGVGIGLPGTFGKAFPRLCFRQVPWPLGIPPGVALGPALNFFGPQLNSVNAGQVPAGYGPVRCAFRNSFGPNRPIGGLAPERNQAPC